ncbi:hypothetical protein ACH5RR_039650 [Cinchona calisaya]|uniref:Uncharacterized protein n=1 Tax=Cinchona calisaya TaxID=153742 RepID=A0ABD2Y299_9GENT
MENPSEDKKHPSPPNKGGLRTMPFIIANNFTPVLGAIVADSYVGRFHMIGFGCVNLLGTVLLWLTTMIPQARPPPCNESINNCSSATSFQLFLLLISFAILSTGVGGIRFLNKASIIRDPQQDLTPDGRAMNPWSLCTVDQVEDLKALLKIIGNFEIPAGSFGVFTIIALILWVALYDQVLLPVASRIKGKPVHLTSKQRMGIGILLSFINMVVTATVESIRRSRAFNEGVSDDPQAIVHMSAIWIVPQYCLIGLTEGFNVIAQNEFFISELPRSMSRMASTLSGVGLSVASLLARFIMNIIDEFTKRGGKESWISSNTTRVIMITIIGFFLV